VQVTVVGDRQGGLLEIKGAPDEIFDPVRAVEQGILRMAVEVYEGHREEDSDHGAPRQRKRWLELIV
jgi:hypothetical protein